MRTSRLPTRLGLLGRILLFVAIFSTFISLTSARPARANSPSEVLALVNALRAERGLPPYRANSALMAAAQGHSEYMASTGNITHTGPNFTNSKARAIAAGYGGDAPVGVTENIAGGTNMTAEQAVSLWRSDAVHISTLLSASHVDAGVGVASDGNRVYYTLDVGYVVGQSGGGESGSPAATTAPGQPTRAPSGDRGFVLVEVQTATPQADGSIVHEVKAGEVLLKIAEAYEVELGELLETNRLTDQSVIFPGQKLTIKTPEPTATPTETLTPTPAPTSTRRPTWTPTATLVATTPVPTTPPPKPTPQSIAARLASDPLLMAIGGLALVGVILLAVGTVLRARPGG